MQDISINRRKVIFKVAEGVRSSTVEDWGKLLARQITGGDALRYLQAIAAKRSTTVDGGLNPSDGSLPY